MVIVTTHTAYVAVLPDPLHLELDASSDPGFVQRGAIRLKSFQLGPTAHVLEASRLVSVLWHPLSETLRPCLVTVTQDAAVRVWEVNRADRWSFNQPASSVDLKKLAKARSIEENIEASEFGASRDFSPDYVEMEVAAASFGGLAGKSGNPWSSMTLWVAMTAGDIYALSPLLPSRWQTHSGHLKALALDVAAIELEHVHPSRVERRRYRRLNKWIIALEECELNSNGSTGTQNCAKLYGRPASFGPIPDLQGPFDIKPSLDGCSDITDLLAVDVTNAARGLYTYSDSKDGDDSDAYDDDSESSSVTSSSFASPRCDNACFELIYILTEASEVHICLGTDIVRGRWLPSAKVSGVDLQNTLTFNIPLNTDDHKGCPIKRFGRW